MIHVSRRRRPTGRDLSRLSHGLVGRHRPRASMLDNRWTTTCDTDSSALAGYFSLVYGCSFPIWCCSHAPRSAHEADPARNLERLAPSSSLLDCLDPRDGSYRGGRGRTRTRLSAQAGPWFDGPLTPVTRGLSRPLAGRVAEAEASRATPARWRARPRGLHSSAPVFANGIAN
jgi:hypothetical protein